MSLIDVAKAISSNDLDERPLSKKKMQNFQPKAPRNNDKKSNHNNQGY
jgi:hypothetical protein